MNDNYFSENFKVESKQNKQSTSVSFSTLIISIITTVVFVVIIVSKRPNIISFVGVWSNHEEQISTWLLNVWDDVSFTWVINSNGDIINYTHTINLLDLGEVGLKSSKINLSNYVDEVYIEWIVERIYQWVPIVSVDTIYSLNLGDELLEEDMTWNNNDFKYLPNIGIYLGSDFFQKYSLLNLWEGWILKIKNSDTNQIINLNYFKCSKSNNNQNCDRFNEMFSESSAQKFVDWYSVNYYKQLDVQSWFFSNDSFFGYFINDTEDVLVKNLVKDIQVINKRFIEKNILNKIDLLCWESGKGIKTMKSNNVVVNNNEIFVDIKWTDGTDSFDCRLKVDPSLKNMAKLVTLTSSWETDTILENTWTVVKNENADYDWDSDVKQFPVTIDKSLTFTSRRWHTFVFPSTKIAYVAQSAEEDFSQVWVNCFSVMNVVPYAEKDLVDQKWNVKIYECSIKKWFDESDKKLIYKNLWDKHFIIQIVDPARVDFANNISISVD